MYNITGCSTGRRANLHKMRLKQVARAPQQQVVALCCGLFTSELRRKGKSGKAREKNTHTLGRAQLINKYARLPCFD